MGKLIRIAVTLFLAGPITGCGADYLAIAVIGSATHRDTYCQTSTGAVYMRNGRRGECDAGDTEIEFEEYRVLYRENAEAETRNIIAANEAARRAKTYCLTSVSNTPYVAASGECQPTDASISETEYQRRKTDQADSLSRLP